MESSLSSGSIGPSPSISSAVSLSQLVEFAGVQRHVASANEFAHDRADLVQDLILGCRFERGQIEPVDQMAVEFDLERSRKSSPCDSDCRRQAKAPEQTGNIATGSALRSTRGSLGPLMKRPSIMSYTPRRMRRDGN